MKKKILTFGLVALMAFAPVAAVNAASPDYQTSIEASYEEDTEVVFNEIVEDEKEYWIVNDSSVKDKNAKEVVVNDYLQAEKVEETKYVGVSAGLNFRTFPNTKYDNVFKALPYGTEVKVVGISEEGWAIAEIDKEKYFCWAEYLTDEQPVIYTPTYNYNYTNTNYNSGYTSTVGTSTNGGQYSASDLKTQGVIHSDGWRWTWYSQNVLPGGGLNIPGRHVDDSGYVCDENGYICLASSSLEKGTVVSTPFGKEGKVYDSGCASDTLDVYTDF